jgi:DnaJ-class molecular chaperone
MSAGCSVSLLKQRAELLACSVHYIILFAVCCSFFGGFGFHFDGAEHSHRKEIQHGSTLTVDLDVTLEELYNGNFIEVILHTRVFIFY